jgi:uncharacterized OB-fold protein
LWREEQGVPRPLASRCAICGHCSFPIAARCRSCGRADPETIALAACGVVEAVSRMGELNLAHVRTDDGVRLLGRLAPEVTVGARVRFVPAGANMGFEPDA